MNPRVDMSEVVIARSSTRSSPFLLPASLRNSSGRAVSEQRA